jgi:hypothetical protein
MIFVAMLGIWHRSVKASSLSASYQPSKRSANTGESAKEIIV